MSEKLNARKANDIFEEGHREKLNKKPVASFEDAIKNLKSQNRILVALKDPDNMYPLDTVLNNITNPDTDIITLYIRPESSTPINPTASKPVDENELFTNIILTAEKYGHTIYPIQITSNEVFYAISQAAISAKVQQIVMGVSGSFGANDQMERLVMAWGALHNGQSQTAVTARILWEGGREVSYKF